jgi:hypothetical protein
VVLYFNAFYFQVIQLKSDGVAFRFLPDSSQVANAIKVIFFLLLMVIHVTDKIIV